MNVSQDAWALVCQHLYFEEHLNLGATCRHLRKACQRPESWNYLRFLRTKNRFMGAMMVVQKYTFLSYDKS